MKAKQRKNDIKANTYNIQYQKLKKNIPNKKIFKSNLRINSSNKNAKKFETHSYRNNKNEKSFNKKVINISNYTEYQNNNYENDKSKERNYNINYYKNKNLSCRACNNGINNSSRSFPPLIYSKNK